LLGILIHLLGQLLETNKRFFKWLAIEVVVLMEV